MNLFKDIVNLNYFVGNCDNLLGIIDIFYDGVSEVVRCCGEFVRIYIVEGFEFLLMFIDEKIDYFFMLGVEFILGIVLLKFDDS